MLALPQAVMRILVGKLKQDYSATSSSNAHGSVEQIAALPLTCLLSMEPNGCIEFIRPVHRDENWPYLQQILSDGCGMADKSGK
jgi:hypothetical protein